jgi:DNA-binding transcriptional ArsR family regulator
LTKSSGMPGPAARWSPKEASVARPIQQFKADFFKALAHPGRIRIVEVLSSGERTVSQLVDDVDLEASHLSQQLGILRRAHVVTDRKEGTTVVYALADERVADLLASAKEILLSYLTEARDLLAVER